jgi:hypothetical protein
MVIFTNKCKGAFCEESPLHLFFAFLSYILKFNPILFGAYINRSNFVGINKAWRFVTKNLRESLPLETH